MSIGFKQRIILPITDWREKQNECEEERNQCRQFTITRTTMTNWPSSVFNIIIIIIIIAIITITKLKLFTS